MNSYLQDPSKPVKETVVSDACTVVDVLGEDVRYCQPPSLIASPILIVLDDYLRNHLIDRYCAIELKEYRRIFRANDEVCLFLIAWDYFLLTHYRQGN